MTDTLQIIDLRQLTGFTQVSAGATAYPPLPIDPFEERSSLIAPPRPSPAPQPSSPGGPAYPSLPVEPETRDDKPGGGR